MESKHTPGPWWMAATGEANGIGYAIGAGNCEIGHMAERGDALLAKAAPELLAALKLHAALPAWPDTEALASAMRATRAAIAKAEGRE